MKSSRRTTWHFHENISKMRLVKAVTAENLAAVKNIANVSKKVKDALKNVRVSNVIIWKRAILRQRKGLCTNNRHFVRRSTCFERRSNSCDFLHSSSRASFNNKIPFFSKNYQFFDSSCQSTKKTSSLSKCFLRLAGTSPKGSCTSTRENHTLLGSDTFSRQHVQTGSKRRRRWTRRH